MKILFARCLLLLLACSTAAAFTSSSTFAGSRLSTRTSNVSGLQMFFGPKDDGSPGDYLCLDCGYVFTKGPEAWAKLPDNWSCPPCGSIKRRFKKVPKGSESGKVTTKKSEKKSGGWFS